MRSFTIKQNSNYRPLEDNRFIANFMKGQYHISIQELLHLTWNFLKKLVFFITEYSDTINLWHQINIVLNKTSTECQGS